MPTNIDNVQDYTGNIALRSNASTFPQDAEDQYTYLAELSQDLNVTVNQMNTAISETNDNATSAEESKDAAAISASSAEASAQEAEAVALDNQAQLDAFEDTFQNRFAFSQPTLPWTPLTVISDELQLYSTGTIGGSGYSVWLADPNLLPFTSSATFAEDEALGRWTVATVATQQWTKDQIAVNTVLIEKNASDIAALEDGQQSGVVVFQTYALLLSYTPQPDEENGSFKVVNDPDTLRNGYYSWVSGTGFTKDASLVKNEIVDTNTSDAVSGRAVANYTRVATSQSERADKTNEYRDSGGLAWAVKDLDGKVALGVKDDGGTVVDEINTAVDPLLGERENMKLFAYAIKDKAGNTALGVDEDGMVTVQLSNSTKEQLGGGAYIAPSETSLDGAFNIRKYPDLMVSTIQETDKTTFDVLERDGLIPIAESPESVEILLTSGQSNAGGGGSGVSEYTGGKKFPYTALSFASLGDTASSYGDNILYPVNLQSLTQLRDADAGVNNQFVGTMSAFAIENRTRETKKPCGIFEATTWYGGEPLTTFVRGTNQWNALMQLAENSVTALSAYGKASYCPAYLFIQGESGAGGGSYYDGITAYIDDVIPELKLKTGQDANPEFFMVQISSGSSTLPGDENGVDLAQYQVAKERAGLGVTMVGPMYQFPLADNIHLTPTGRMAQGELIADVYNTVVTKGEQFQPLMPNSVTISSNVVTLVFDVPAGDIEFDTDWVEPTANYGFEYSDDTDTASISSVAITSSDTIQITLDQVPTGANKLIKYAQPQTITTGWSATRGQLRSPTKVSSFYYAQGYDVPEYVIHYCLRFSEAIL